jgi:hypothetical protein
VPPPLPAQSRITQLNHPLFVGPARRRALDRLQRHFSRRFADQWEFVRFANEHHRDLDLKTPPPRSALPPFAAKRRINAA